MSRRVTVHHFVANLATRQHGTGRPSHDLLDVNYWREVPADTEFPRVFGRLDVFARFYLNRAKPVEYHLRVWWNDAPHPGRELIGQYGPFVVPFRVDDLVRDRVFRLQNLQLRGVGRHTIRLVRLLPTSVWRRGRWAIVAETHFFVER